MLYSVEAVFVALLGRPLLILLSWLRWPLLVLAFVFSDYGATSGSAHFTIIPGLVGITLWAAGTAVRRYAEAYRDFVALTERLESHPLAAHMLMLDAEEEEIGGKEDE